MPQRKVLKCECNQRGCITCYNRNYRRTHTSSLNKRISYNRRKRETYQDNLLGPLFCNKVTSRPVQIGFSTDLLLDRLTDEEVLKMSYILGFFSYSVSENLPSY